MHNFPFLVYISVAALVVLAVLITASLIAGGKRGRRKALAVGAFGASGLLVFVFWHSLIARKGYFPALIVLSVLLGMVFWVAALIDCPQNESDKRNSRLIWVLAIVFGRLLGAPLYWLWRHPQRQAEARA